jgi:hypothetical protein
MSKMGFHCSFGYLKHKIWAKERPGVKLAIGNWQFDSRPLKVGNQPDSLAFRRRATYLWKALDEGYNFSSDHIAIRGLHKKLCALKVAEVSVDAISGLPLGSPGTKNHLDVAPMERRKVYYKGGKWWLPPSPGHGESCVSGLPMARPSTKSAPTMH